jgi:prepilin-type N-terminal cleavage/methylation domain-containing protein
LKIVKPGVEAPTDLKSLKKNQTGFTLIELVVAMAITGILGVGVFTALFQIRNVNDTDNARMSAVKQVENAVYYINRDAQSAQTITPGGDSGFPLTLTWKTWGTPTASPPVPPSTQNIIYSLDSNGILSRSDGSSSKQIARYISTDSDDTNCSYNLTNHRITIQISAIYTIRSKQAREMRQIEIVPRPGS